MERPQPSLRQQGAGAQCRPLFALTLSLSPCRLAKALPRRALSVEDVSAPSLARTVGRVVEVFPDGTSQLQLQRSPEGTFGFCVASGNGRRDSGRLPVLSGLHSLGTLANCKVPFGCDQRLFSGLWQSSGALDSGSLLSKGLEFSLRGLFLKSQGMGLLEGVSLGRLDPTVPLLSAGILETRISKANFSLGSQREIVCACRF